jgi:DNA-binding transcriptional LysR family regulator
MRREDLADLMSFAVIAEERSFTRAAARLGISSSALSHSIRLLEGRLATRLLSRTTRSVAPTRAGERLLERLGPALREIGTGLETLAEERDHPSGTVRINSHRVGAIAHVAPKIAELNRRYPDVILEVTVDDTPVDIVSAAFDAGIRHGEHLAQDMVAVRISSNYRSALVAAPGYVSVAEPIVSPRDVVRHPCLAWRYPSSGVLFRWEFRRGDEELSVAIEPAFVTNDMHVLVAAALSGAGVAYLLKDYVADHLTAGRLVELLPDSTVPHDACYLYYPSRRQVRPAMRAVIEVLKCRD